MARALTTSEANKRLIELGFEWWKPNTIEDNEFTLPFGQSNYWYEETTNMFDHENKFRWWNVKGVRFMLSITETTGGKSFLSIGKFTEKTGERVVDYSKLSAAGKKKFMEIFENLATKRQAYKLPGSNITREQYVWGDALPSKFKEF